MNLAREAKPPARRFATPTEIQRRVLGLIAGTHGGAPPSMREVAKAIGVTSTNAVNDHYVALIRKGLLKRDPLKSRAVKVTAAGLRAIGLRRCSGCEGEGWVSA